MSEESNYEKLAAVNVNGHIEKKGKFSYLSWAWAVQTLLKQDPTATWSYAEPKEFNGSVMVFCEVTAFGKSMNMQLPVLNFQNKAIKNPDAMDVNTAMMRCLVKAIAVHGLGLYIYAGEDLPEDDGKVKGSTSTATTGAWDALSEEEQAFLQGIADNAITMLAEGNVQAAHEYLTEQKLDADEKVALTTRLNSKQRSTLTKYRESLKENKQ